MTVDQENKQQEDSAASKQGEEIHGTTIGVSAGVGIFVVIVAIGVVVGIVLRRKKLASVAPHPPHIQNTTVSDKVEPTTTIVQQKSADQVELGETVADKPELGAATQTPKTQTEFVDTGGEATFTLGQRVSVLGYPSGVIMYIGKVESMPIPCIGIKLDKPEGTGDGTVNGVRYFDCDEFCSVFVAPHSVHAETAL